MLTNWHFKKAGDWQNLPNWCSKYSAIGRHVAEHQSSNRLVIALAVPTRAYAATFLSLGIVLSQATLPTEETDCDDHFLDLCSLPSGTPVTYRDKNRVLNAILEGYYEQNGNMYIVIRINSGHKKRIIPPSLANNIQVSDAEFIKLPKNQRGKVIVDEVPLLSACVEAIDVSEYTLHSRLGCTIIGNKKALAREIQEVPFAIRSGSSQDCFQQGVIQDILRTRQFIRDGQGYRSSVRSDREKKLLPDSNTTPFAVVFDSATGFLRWRDSWRSSHWVVILDKTETAFEDAVSELNRECIDYRLENTALPLPALPPGVEALSYQEALR